VYDPTAVGKLVTQLSRQVQQITVAQQQLQAAINATKKLGTYNLRQITTTMTQIDQTVAQGQALAYTLSTIDADFRKTFPGSTLSTTMDADMRTQRQRTLATLRGALNAANLTTQQLAAGVTRLQAIKAQLPGVRSAQEIAELQGVVGVHTAEEITLLRQQLAAQQSAQVVAMAEDVNHRMQAAAYQRAYDAPSQVINPRPTRRNISGWGF
jgi:P-type conjugative transfer protein TrbJ